MEEELRNYVNRHTYKQDNMPHRSDWRELYEKAKIYAGVAHQGQMYGEDPYTAHLDHVDEILTNYGFESYLNINDDYYSPIMIAGYLHDIIEDTKVTREDLEREFNSDVAELVWRVTDESGRNRKERKAKTMPKILGDPRSVIIKIADRLGNIENCIKYDNQQHKYSSSLYGMYRGENQGFIDAVAPYAIIPVCKEMLDYLRNIFYDNEYLKSGVRF